MTSVNVKYDSDYNDYQHIEPEEYGVVTKPRINGLRDRELADPKIAAGAGNYSTLQKEQPSASDVLTTAKNEIAAEPTKTGKELILEAYRRNIFENAPKPTFDATAPEYYKRAAKYNLIAKGLSLLADSFSLAKGGNVNRPQPDNKIPTYINQHFKYLDDYRNKHDMYNLQNYQNSLRYDELRYRADNEQKALALAENRYNEEKKWREGEIARAKEIGDYKKAQELELMEERQKNEMEQLKEVSKRYEGRSSGRSSGEAADKRKTIQLNDGTVIPMNPETYSLYLDKALRNPQLQNDSGLFETVQEFDKTTGEPIQRIKLKSGINDDALIRAQLELEMEQQKSQEAVLPPVEYPGFPGRPGEKLPNQSQFPKYKPKTSKEVKPKVSEDWSKYEVK
jgi:hypothetical protein